MRGDEEGRRRKEKRGGYSLHGNRENKEEGEDMKGKDGEAQRE